MSAPAEDVAARFQCQFGRPKGAVNTLVFRDASGVFLRVLVDPRYWLTVGELPLEYEGYRVVKERRPDAVAYH